MTYPSGTIVTATYGADGCPIEIRVNDDLLMSNITYHPFGEPKSRMWSNNHAHNRSFDYDAGNRLTNQSNNIIFKL